MSVVFVTRGGVVAKICVSGCRHRAVGGAARTFPRECQGGSPFPLHMLWWVVLSSPSVASLWRGDIWSWSPVEHTRRAHGGEGSSVLASLLDCWFFRPRWPLRLRHTGDHDESPAEWASQLSVCQQSRTGGGWLSQQLPLWLSKHPWAVGEKLPLGCRGHSCRSGVSHCPAPCIS